MNQPRFTLARKATMVISATLVVLAGCQSQAKSSKRETRRPSPPVQSASSILNEQAVSKRARELINEGKYTTTVDARRAAQREVGSSAGDTASSDWSAEYARYEKQVKEQEKFEADFAKSRRGY